MPQGGCLWPQGLSSSTAIWSFGRAGGLRLWAVSWDSDAPSFWSYNQRKVYFWSLKTSIFKSQAGRYYVCVPFSRTFDQTMQFASGTSLSGFAHYSTRKSKNHNVNIWRTKIWSFWSHFSMPNGGQWGCGDGHDHGMCPQRDRTYSGLFTAGQLLIGLNVHSNLSRLIRDGGKWGGGDGYLCPTMYSLHCHHQNDSVLRWAAVWDIWMFH